MSNYHETREREDEARWGMTYAPDVATPGPVDLAQEAHQRGDRLFQVDIPVAWIQGVTAIDAAATRIQRPPRGDVLGAIEAVGWRLEHMSGVYIVNGSSSTSTNISTYRTDRTADHGTLIGLYVFRRADLVTDRA